MKDFNYTLTEIESMLPWERETYVTLLINDLNLKNQRKASKTIEN